MKQFTLIDPIGGRDGGVARSKPTARQMPLSVVPDMPGADCTIRAAQPQQQQNWPQQPVRKPQKQVDEDDRRQPQQQIPEPSREQQKGTPGEDERGGKQSKE